MSIRTYIKFILSLSAFALCVFTAAASAKPQRYVVVFQGGAIPNDAASVMQSAGGTLVKTFR